MYLYVTCITGIGYGVTILSKFSPTPSDYHYSCLNNLSRYLRITRDWDIRYKIRGPRLDFPYPRHHTTVWDKNIPKQEQ